MEDDFPRCAACDNSVDFGSTHYVKCHKSAPIAHKASNGTIEGGWPTVSKTDFCGQHTKLPKNEATELLREIKELLKEGTA